MKIDPDGLDNLRALELCKLVAYWDVNGWALGYGQHGPSIREHSTCTKQDAELWLQSTCNTLSVRLSDLIVYPVNQGQFNVMVICTYNIGISAFAGSHILSRLNSGNLDSVPSELARWVHSDGEVNPILVKRRKKEIELWKAATNPAHQQTS